MEIVAKGTEVAYKEGLNMSEYVTKQELNELADRISVIEGGYVHRDEFTMLQTTIHSQSTALLSLSEAVRNMENVLHDQSAKLDRLEEVWNERFAAIEREVGALNQTSQNIERKLDQVLERLG